MEVNKFAEHTKAFTMEGVVSMEAWALNIGFSNIYSKKFHDHAPSQIRMPDDIAAFGSTGGNKRIDLRSIRRNYGKPPQKGTGRVRTPIEIASCHAVF
eukprot:jgi/Bigna1/144423/aug1.87_g19131